MRQNSILSPDMKEKSKLRAVHSWKEYTAISEVFDLALIELREGFQLSKEESVNIRDRIDLSNKKINLGKYNLFSNLSGNGIYFAVPLFQISESQNCVTILPFDLEETQYDLVSGTSESMSGYTLVDLDILIEETCMKKMKVHDFAICDYDYDKHNIKNIICSKTNAIAMQKVKEHVSMYCMIHRKSSCRWMPFKNRGTTRVH